MTFDYSFSLFALEKKTCLFIETFFYSFWRTFFSLPPSLSLSLWLNKSKRKQWELENCLNISFRIMDEEWGDELRYLAWDLACAIETFTRQKRVACDSQGRRAPFVYFSHLARCIFIYAAVSKKTPCTRYASDFSVVNFKESLNRASCKEQQVVNVLLLKSA